jgi:hypothetical protein
LHGRHDAEAEERGRHEGERRADRASRRRTRTPRTPARSTRSSPTAPRLRGRLRLRHCDGASFLRIHPPGESRLASTISLIGRIITGNVSTSAAVDQVRGWLSVMMSLVASPYARYPQAPKHTCTTVIPAIERSEQDSAEPAARARPWPSSFTTAATSTNLPSPSSLRLLVPAGGRWLD